MRFVFLDPDGTAGLWLYVVVEHRTGIVYQTQYGGTATWQGQVEGYRVPITAHDALDALRRWPGSGLTRLRELIGTITYWACDGEEERPSPLVLDESRAAEIDEAWVPVITADGPGVLLWSNSD